jgi:hypothetical protein
MIAGIVVLARHAPAVTRQLQEAADSSQGPRLACVIVANTGSTAKTRKSSGTACTT